MKYQLCDFLDSKTLCEQLKGQTVSPAVECILIAQSRKRNLETKLLALSERYHTFSRQAFQEGVYNLPDAPDFYSALSNYIEKMRSALDLTKKAADHTVVFHIHDSLCAKPMFSAFSDAIAYITKNNLEDVYIERYKINSDERPIAYILNADNEITAIQTYDISEGWDLELAFAEFPYTFQVGDLISYRENYFVLASVCHADADTRWLPRADDTDMQLYCYCYEPDRFDFPARCFGHYHVPIQYAELASPDMLPESQKPLLALSKTLKGEMQITLFLELCSVDFAHWNP